MLRHLKKKFILTHTRVNSHRIISTKIEVGTSWNFFCFLLWFFFVEMQSDSNNYVRLQDDEISELGHTIKSALVMQVINFPPRPDENDINFSINSSLNSLRHLTWADLGTILKTLANERKNIYYPGRFYSVVSCVHTWKWMLHEYES